ncbi:hypothetical protein KZX46_13555 [Polymorphobacter sp. PAMC 29334]|uniref:hypothetical protein n=1 Tax=Polymorphobacter sp. PAMC 29334 TaxID=2862331 RepID=UPI001C77145C|nr:hypothetical protein [Polymorphobacter sp. PAMC 29334]QYE33851.1 hypothetical protein KZX46_13555 [Polymorphobacter sp. PAMC 29334]
MNKAYATSLGFGLVGLVFVTIFFDSYRLASMGRDATDSLDGSAIYALVIAAILGFSARLIFVASVSQSIKMLIRGVLSVVMAAVIVATLAGFALLASGKPIDGFTLGFAVLSSVSAGLWLIRYNRPVAT